LPGLWVAITSFPVIRPGMCALAYDSQGVI
jgi:hypothetical protein